MVCDGALPSWWKAEKGVGAAVDDGGDEVGEEVGGIQGYGDEGGGDLCMCTCV